MFVDVLLRELHNVALPFVREFARRFFEGQPERKVDLLPHFLTDVIDLAGAVQKKEEADNLEDLFTVAPAADVDVLDVGELSDKARLDAGFFQDFALGSDSRFFAVVHQALGKGQHTGLRRAILALALGFNGSEPPPPLHAAQYDPTGREFTSHG